MQKKENQFEDAVLNWNLGDRETSALQYLGGYAFKKILQKIVTFTKNFEIEKKYKIDEFQQCMALLPAWRLTNTEILLEIFYRKINPN